MVLSRLAAPPTGIPPAALTSSTASSMARSSGTPYTAPPPDRASLTPTVKVLSAACATSATVIPATPIHAATRPCLPCRCAMSSHSFEIRHRPITEKSTSMPQVGIADLGVVAQAGAAATEHHMPGLQHIATICHTQSHGDRLLDQQHGHAALLDRHQAALDLIDNLGCQPQRGFVEEAQAGPCHQRPGNRQHFLLSAR